MTNPLPLNTVICGDNCEVMNQWPDECIDMVMTSPPYDDLRKYGGHSWDFEGVAAQLTRCLKHGGVIVWVVADATVNGSETLTSMRQAIHFHDVCGLNVHDTMIYASDKPPHNDKRYEPAWEYMFVLSKGKPSAWNPLTRASINPGGRSGKFYYPDVAVYKQANSMKRTAERVTERNLWAYATGHEKIGHPAPFPESLAKDHIQSWSNPGDTILDPFAGSGTTLKAAKELNRHYIGIEINPEYVEICHNRTAQGVLDLF